MTPTPTQGPITPERVIWQSLSSRVFRPATAEWVRAAGGADISNLDRARRRGCFERNYDAGFEPFFANGYDSRGFAPAWYEANLRPFQPQQFGIKSTGSASYASLRRSPVSVNLDQISLRRGAWTWTWTQTLTLTGVFSRPALSLEHSACWMQEVAGFLRLWLRDKRQSRSKTESMLECAKEQRA